MTEAEAVAFPPVPLMKLVSPAPPVAVSERVTFPEAVTVAEAVAFPPMVGRREILFVPLMPPMAVRVEALSVVGVRVAEAVAFPPFPSDAPLPAVAVMVLAGSEEVTVAEASWPVPLVPDSMSVAAWRVEWMAKVSALARRSLGSLGVGIFSPMWWLGGLGSLTSRASVNLGDSYFVFCVLGRVFRGCVI